MKPHLPLLLFLAGLLLSATASAQKADQKKATVAYLHALETRGGGFRGSHKASAPSLGATNACLRALKYFGGKPRDAASCRSFVLSCRDEMTGGFADAPGGKPDVILTALGLMALVELKVPTEKYNKSAIAFLADRARGFEEIRMAAAGLEAVGKRSEKNDAWLADLARRQNPDGTFGKGKALPRDTGGAIACILRLGGKVKKPRTVVTALDRGQNADGGFGPGDSDKSDLATSYRIVRTYHMLEAAPARSDALEAFVARCRNAEGGYGVTPGAASTAAGTYYAAMVLHWLDAK